MKDMHFISVISFVIVASLLAAAFLISNPAKAPTGMFLAKTGTNSSFSLLVNPEIGTVVGGTKSAEYIALTHTDDYVLFSISLEEGTYVLNSVAKGTNPPVMIKVGLNNKDIGTMSLSETDWATNSMLLGYLQKGSYSLKYTFLNDAKNRDAFIKSAELVKIDSNIKLGKNDYQAPEEKSFVRLPFAVKSSEKYSEHLEFGKKYSECPAVNVTKNKLTITEDAGDANDFANDGFNINPSNRFSEPKIDVGLNYRELINSTLHYISFDPSKYFSDLSAFELDKNNITHLKAYLTIRYQDNTLNTSKNFKKVQWENTPANGCKWTYLDFNPICSPEGKADGLWKEITCELTGVTKIWSNMCNKTSSWANFDLVNMKGDNLDYAQLSFEGFNEKYFAPKDNANYYTLDYTEVPHRTDYFYKTINNTKYCAGADVEMEPKTGQTASDFQKKENSDVIILGKNDSDNGNGYIEKDYYSDLRYAEEQTARECNNIICPFWVKISDTSPYVINITLSTVPDDFNKKTKEYELLYYDNDWRVSFPSKSLGIKKVDSRNTSLTSLAWLASEDVLKNMKSTEINNGKVRFYLKQNGKVIISRIETGKFYYTGYQTKITPLYNYQNATYNFEWSE